MPTLEEYFKEKEEKSTLNERCWFPISTFGTMYRAKTVYGAALNLPLNRQLVEGLILYDLYMEARSNHLSVDEFPPVEEMIQGSDVILEGYLYRLLRSYPDINIISPQRYTGKRRKEKKISLPSHATLLSYGNGIFSMEEGFWQSLIFSCFSLTVRKATEEDYYLLQRGLHSYLRLAVYWYDLDLEATLQELEDTSTEVVRYWGLGEMASTSRPYVYTPAKTLFGALLSLGVERREPLLNRVIDSLFFRKYLHRAAVRRIKDLKERTEEKNSPLFPPDLKEEELGGFLKSLEEEIHPLLDIRVEISYLQ